MIELTNPPISPQVGANITELLQTGSITEGRFTDQLSAAVREQTDTTHAIPVSSCTTGLELALEACDIGPGDEVIVPDFTYPAPATVCARLGATPVPVDVRPDRYTIDIEAARAAVTDRTAAIVPVSLFGQPLEPGPLRRLAEAHDLDIIEDAAWSLGAAWDGQPVGSQFDCSVFSFHGKKPVPVGEGGIITTDDSGLAERIRSAREFGFDGGEQGSGMVRPDGTNYKLSELQAAMAVGQLANADNWQAHRASLAEVYTERLDSVVGIDPPVVPVEATHTFGAYVVVVTEAAGIPRDQLISVLREAGIETAPGNFTLHTLEVFDTNHTEPLRTASRLDRRALKLPITQSMACTVVDTIVDTIEGILGTTKHPVRSV